MLTVPEGVGLQSWEWVEEHSRTESRGRSPRQYIPKDPPLRDLRLLAILYSLKALVPLPRDQDLSFWGEHFLSEQGSPSSSSTVVLNLGHGSFRYQLFTL